MVKVVMKSPDFCSKKKKKQKKKKNLVSFFTENAAGDSPQLSVPSRVAWAEES